MATSSTKKTAKPDGEAAPVKKPRAVKTATPKKVPAKGKTPPAEPTDVAPAAVAIAAEEKITPKGEAAPAVTPPASPALTEETVDESKIIQMKPPIQVRDLATRLNLKPFQLIHELM